MLGTGAGKSTFFFRCAGHGGAENKGKGATLVLPYSSLVGSVLNAHVSWLATGKDTDPEKRVTICAICGG